MQKVKDWLLQSHDLWDDLAITKADFECLLMIPPADREVRADRAVGLIKSVLSQHSKEDFGGELTTLGELERQLTKDGNASHRDHVTHSLFTYVLGWALYQRWLTPQHVQAGKITKLQWSITALLHDVGYLRLAGKRAQRRFLNTVSKAELEMRGGQVQNPLTVETFTDLGKFGNSIDKVNDQLKEWKLSNVDLRGLWNQNLVDPTCHGMWSSLALLHSSAILYDRFRWDAQGFLDKIVQPATAILLHDLPLHASAGIKMSPGATPLAFLLRVSDALQDWERPSGLRRCGFRIDRYEIQVQDELIWCVGVSGRKKIMEKDLHSISPGLVTIRQG